MPNANRPAGPASPKKEALDHVKTREGLDETAREIGAAAVPEAHRPPARSKDADNQDDIKG
ncbi:hypothetical protein [Eleftheria terrae]|uniref:hypothetical protein n=1 Tax=Eleftheria terrae TaxID=1597781 RepID=UPI00263BBA5B|nr:hypothetical protein [Eleftheria terrae]WKB51715.1 hypothetical protein N7L95_18200 [Eleftheria terrae]